jgi:hypothetical protein
VPGTNKYKSNLAFALFVALAVAAVIGIVLLLNSDAGEDNSSPKQARADPRPQLACQFEGLAGEVRVVFDPVGGSCAPARRIYRSFIEMALRGEVDGYEQTSVEGWACREYPFSDYPLLVHCTKGGRQFEVLGLAPSAHQGG